MAERDRQRVPSPVERDRRVHAVVAAIAPGTVASYGQVAERAGLPRGARLVARALAHGPPDLPWHRVINAAGRIAFPAGSAGFREQARRLRREGVEVSEGRVPRRCMPSGAADLDALLWGPGPPVSPPPAGRRRR